MTREAYFAIRRGDLRKEREEWSDEIEKPNWVDDIMNIFELYNERKLLTSAHGWKEMTKERLRVGGETFF